MKRSSLSSRSKHTTPALFIVFGATGDLATKKIFPALWYLFERDLLPERFALVGIAKTERSNEDFQAFAADVIRARNRNVSEEKLNEFLSRLTYCAGAFEDTETFNTLSGLVKQHEDAWGVCGNKLMYLAVPPPTYETIFEGLAFVSLNTPCGGKDGWSRVLVEKPFGNDLKSAEELQATLTHYFTKEQIYRIDHYLFKEIVQGIENFRFSNNLFEHAWDNSLIDSIDIRLHEPIGVSGRGAFYDHVGALRDVGQNHMLSVLSFLTADHAPSGDAAEVRANRIKLLSSLAEWTKTDIKERTYRAQFAGFTDIDGVSSDSQTETYFALQTEIANNRWKGVPIRMDAGKRLGEARKEVVVTLKHPSPCMLCNVGVHGPNKIVFRLEPRDEIVIHFWTKKPGFEKQLEERTFSFFLYEKENKTQYVEEYAKVLYDAMAGDQSLFINHEEVKALWQFVDPVTEAWRSGAVPLETYTPGGKPKPDILADQELFTSHARIDRGQIGMIGLGKMGANLARQLNEKGWDVVGYNKSNEATETLAETDVITGASSLKDLAGKMEARLRDARGQAPRTIWIMVPHKAVDSVLTELTPHLAEGDTVIDGGNSHFKESVRRAKELAEQGIYYLDAGISGGPEGAREGVCAMVGGPQDVFDAHEELFSDMSVSEGYRYVGESGAGHFVKMVHNGIEYGMMQSIAEGFDVLSHAPFSLDLFEIADLYNHGSVIESNLIGWLADAYQKFGQDLTSNTCCSATVDHTGEGEWTVEFARELGVPVSIIEGALDFRKTSTEDLPHKHTGRVVSALRHEFGGHDATPDIDEHTPENK